MGQLSRKLQSSRLKQWASIIVRKALAHPQLRFVLIHKSNRTSKRLEVDAHRVIEVTVVYPGAVKFGGKVRHLKAIVPRRNWG